MAEPSARIARTTGMTPILNPNAVLAALREEVSHLLRVDRELLDTVTKSPPPLPHSTVASLEAGSMTQSPAPDTEHPT
jgi:hypothetical protein